MHSLARLSHSSLPDEVVEFSNNVDVMIPPNASASFNIVYVVVGADALAFVADDVVVDVAETVVVCAALSFSARAVDSVVDVVPETVGMRAAPPIEMSAIQAATRTACGVLAFIVRQRGVLTWMRLAIACASTVLQFAGVVCAPLTTLCRRWQQFVLGNILCPATITHICSDWLYRTTTAHVLDCFVCVLAWPRES